MSEIKVERNLPLADQMINAPTPPTSPAECEGAWRVRMDVADECHAKGDYAAAAHHWRKADEIATRRDELVGAG